MSPDQTEFYSALVDPAHRRPDGLADGTGRPAGRRFDVYRNNVAVSLTEALETAFPVLRKLLGAGNFRLLARAYLHRHPPSSPLMIFYGERMPGFLSAFEPAKSIAYLPDVARLELALRESYHAADAAPVERRQLASVPIETLLTSQIALAPSLRLIRSVWPLHAIWRYNTQPGAPRPDAVPEDVVVLRPDFDPLPHPLPLGGAAFIEGLLEGKSFGEAAEAAAEEAPSFDMSMILTLLIANGAIIAIGEPA